MSNYPEVIELSEGELLYELLSQQSTSDSEARKIVHSLASILANSIDQAVVEKKGNNARILCVIILRGGLLLTA